MHFEHLTVGELGTNCYLVTCPETRVTAVIDPGGSAKKILAVIAQKNLVVKFIINTHGHYDHIQANRTIKEQTNAEILIHELDADYLVKPSLSLSSYFGEDKGGLPADRLLKDGDVIEVGKIVKIKVIHTPGHTPGGISLLTEKHLFAGDTLFAGSVGRTDLPGGSMRALINSIKTKLIPLGDDILVYPGHGPFTTIGDERNNNPFLV